MVEDVITRARRTHAAHLAAQAEVTRLRGLLATAETAVTVASAEHTRSLAAIDAEVTRTTEGV